MNRKKNERTMKKSCRQTVVHLHLWYFQSVMVWQESSKDFTRVWHNCYLKTETFRSRFLVIGFEQKVCFGLLK